jgi:hypothetical protein
MPVALRPLTPDRSDRRALYLVIGALGLAVLALGAMVVRGQLAQRGAQIDSGNLVQAAGQSSAGPLVQVPGEAAKAQPLVQKPDTPPENAPVPADVLDYLAWLKQIERQKRDLINAHASRLETIVATLPGDIIKNLLQDITNDSPGGQDAAHPRVTMEEVEKMIAQVTTDWNSIAVTFNQRTPPNSCRELHARYYDHLNTAGQQFVEVMTIFSRAFSGQQSDIRAARTDLAAGVQGMSSKTDQSMRQADHALADVCRTFRITKDFEIGEDKRSSGSGLGGLLGM